MILQCSSLAFVFSILCRSATACRSNSTNVCWNTSTQEESSQSRGLTQSSCWCQSRKAAEQDALAYLKRNIMPFDVPNMESLGFSSRGAADGLDNGLVGPSVSLALDAKIRYAWADAVPREVYHEYVVNYAHTNEARTNWRPLVEKAVSSILKDMPPDATIEKVVKAINEHLWTNLGGIEFKSGQTPLIFDPMSVIAFRYGSCTGLSVLFACALRAAGVPARIAGTPAWLGLPENGNHNWVEVFVDDEWKFLEASPAAASVDTLDRDPCSRWFCNSEKEYGKTKVYAARLDRDKADAYYPMAWEWDNKGVPGVDRTEYYKKPCSQCK